ncbi:MAG: glycosyltransferase [Burkholderiales bacterium]|jgi:glycosyltransferase involved in cell wall biosynthesis
MTPRDDRTAPHRATSGPRRVAVVHEWLLDYAGSERVTEAILRRFPDAVLFTLVDRMAEADRGWLAGRTIRTSALQRLPGLPGTLKYAVPFMPLAIEQFDLSGFDLVVSSSHAVAKGVIVPPDALHLCYCHSPMRYAWDLQATYLETERLSRGPKGWAARLMLHRMRLWDHRSAAGVDAFAANSAFVARRILKAYRREAVVIPPPVSAPVAPAVAREPDHYVTVSRLMGYKRVDLIVDAFRALPDRRLTVIGDGPEAARLRASAPPNVRFAGHVPTAELRAAVARARAFVFAAVEDFGIAPVEALALGTPVVALRRGGTAETVAGLDDAWPTGALFDEQTPQSLVAAIEAFERASARIHPAACVQRAARYSAAAFDRRFGDWVDAEWDRWQARLRDGEPRGSEPAPRRAEAVDA